MELAKEGGEEEEEVEEEDRGIRKGLE